MNNKNDNIYSGGGSSSDNIGGMTSASKHRQQF